MPEAVIEDLDRGTVKRIAINGARPDFLLGSERISASALASIDPSLTDFLHIASAVFFADGYLPRGGQTRPSMGARWRRHLRVTVEVHDPDLWSDGRVVAALAELVEFFTEDRIEFQFKPVAEAPLETRFLDLDPREAAYQAEEVVLFSGGLDSFSGALEALSTTPQNVLLVSHRSAQKVLPRQDLLSAYLAKQYPGRVRHIKVIARRAGAQASETTQRSRSLLFAALGQAVAKTFGASRVCFYENGTVSHNLPISHQVVGTMATRTTHPLGLLKLNQLFQMILEAPLTLSNPYEWFTKSEVVERIRRHGGESQIRYAVSCTSVREQTKLHPHCGTCSQCLDRRFGILAAGLGAHDPEEQYNTDVLLGERDDEQSIKMAVEWTRHAMRLNSMEMGSFFSKFGLELSRIAQGHPEMAASDLMEKVHSLSRRHADGVRHVLTSAVAENAAALAAGSVPQSSLLLLHLGSNAGGGERRLTPSVDSEPALVTIPEVIKAEDISVEPKAPLQVAFLVEDDRPVVSVVGLARIAGSKAQVPHALKPYFDEDRSNGLSPSDHRFVLDFRRSCPNLSKQAVRQNVNRCRAMLAKAHADIHGEPPSRPLLIENKLRAGYRLDPTIILTNQKT